MEQGLGSLNKTSSARNRPESTSIPNPNRSIDKRQKDFIFIGAQSTGVDLMCATNGALMTESDLLGLQYGGFLDYSTEDILENSYFDGIDDFNDVVLSAYEQYQAKEKEKRDIILAEMKDSGLSEFLFRKIEDVAVEGLSLTKKLKSGELLLVKDVGVISEELVDEYEAIARYTKYKLAKKLLQGVRSDVGERWLFGIAMGIFLEEEKTDADEYIKERPLVNGTSDYGKKISSYQSEIYKVSKGTTTQADVEMATEAAEVYDYIFPDRLKKYHKILERSAKKPVIIGLKDKERAYQFRTDEISIDIKRKRLLIGETAVKAVIEKGAKPETIHKLGQLLLDNSLDINIVDPNHFIYKKWSRDDYTSYGQWLIRLVAPKKLDKNILLNAMHLGLGPGPKGIAGAFGNNVNFFNELDQAGLSQYGMYDEWELKDFVEHIKRVANEIGRRPTQPILNKRVKDGAKEPTPITIRRITGSFTSVMEAAGFPKYNKKLSVEEVLERGLSFYKATSRLPSRKDAYESELCPSYKSIRNYFGTLSAFQDAIKESVQNSFEVGDIAA